MAPKFGTSGLRGLVQELTPELVQSYCHAFLQACEIGPRIFVGMDLRPSSPGIASNVIAAIRSLGLDAEFCGALPTPALAYAARQHAAAAIMVTGSHIPADRNGLKFFSRAGEITKADEAAMTKLARPVVVAPAEKLAAPNGSALADYQRRYVSAYGPRALQGLRLGIYQHSSVARGVLDDICRALGAETALLGRSEEFVPVDTEAVDPRMRERLAGWCQDDALDAILSTDGDADRPMLTDECGQLIAGDVLGVLTARALGADSICTPISSNSMVADLPEFEDVTLTRIGSRYVIEAMEAVLGQSKVIGYEANGGFLLGFSASGPVGELLPLLTRDAVLPMIATLVDANAQGVGLAHLVKALPQKFTAADRIADFPTKRSKEILRRLSQDEAFQGNFFSSNGNVLRVDLTDGLRVYFEGNLIVHLRPSGNAPEFRIYAEARSKPKAVKTVRDYKNKILQYI